jgi:O-antigen/teichoic acid export membrane protein
MVAFAVQWTFWPSLAITLAMLAVGRPVLSLFGHEYAIGYELLFILSTGMMARASVGPAERLLNMLGAERACAVVYAVAFAATLVFCLVLVPRYGLVGAAAGAALGMFVEAGLLAWAVKARLGLRAFIWPRLLGR